MEKGPIWCNYILFVFLFSEKAGVELDGGSYLIHKIYDDEETLSLVAAACETLGMQYSKLFSSYFIDYKQVLRYTKFAWADIP